MVERLKAEPFALLGINSDGDRDVSKKLSEEEKNAIKGLGAPEGQSIDAIRRGDEKVIEKLGAAGPALRKKVFDIDLANLQSILEKQNVTWRQAVLGTTRGALPAKWNVQGWPTIYILDAKGVIRFRDLRGEEMEAAVLTLIKEAKEGGKH